jgi:predicted O-methyltransferase YrrM
MYESVRGTARRVLVIGTQSDNRHLSPDDALAAEGKMIVMESDSARAEELRQRFTSAGYGDRATVIGGDPRRMLYKLAGPFDVIFYDSTYQSVRPMLEKLLAPTGVLIPNDNK